MTSRQKQSIRIGTTEHIVRRFFDILVMLVLTVFIGYITWKQQENLDLTDLASAGIDPASIVTVANTDSQ